MEAAQRRFTVHAPEALAEASDLVTRSFPRVLLTWKTRSGEALSGEAFKAFIELWDRRAGARGFLELNFTEFGAFFNKSDASARRWIKDGLQPEGLVRVRKGRRGPKGGAMIYVYDPRTIAARRGLVFVEAPTPQLQLPFAGEGKVETNSTEPSDSVTSDFSGQPGVQGCAETGQVRTVGTGGCAIADDDPLSALQTAFQSALGEDYQVWLKPCRFSLAGAELTILAPDQFKLDWIRRKCLAKVRELAAQAACGPLAVRLELGPRQAGPQSGSSTEHPPPFRLRRVAPNSTEPSNCAGPHSTVPLSVPSNSRCAIARVGGPLDGSVVGSVGGAQPTKHTNQTNQTTKQRDFSQADSTEPSSAPNPLLLKAAALYARIGDSGLYRWFSIAAALAVEEGKLTDPELDRIVRDDPFEFAARLKAALAGKSGLANYVCLKTALHRRGIKWRRQWDRSEKQCEQASRERAADRRSR